MRGFLVLLWVLALGAVWALAGCDGRALEAPSPLPSLPDLAPPGCQPPGDAVGWWRAEDSTLDEQQRMPGIPMGDVRYSTGVVGRAFELAPPAHVDVPQIAALVQHRSFSFALWAHLDDALNGPTALAAVWAETDGQRAWSLSADAGGHVAFTVSADGASTAVAGPTRPLGQQQWTHVAGVFDAESRTLTVYLDGAAEAARAAADGINAVDRQMSFGAADLDGTKRAWPGALDELRLYGRALSDAEVACLAQR
jgi:Concanavalin A-like lectin/glucanases superfamily